MNRASKLFTTYDSWNKAYYNPNIFYAIKIKNELIPFKNKTDKGVFIYGVGYKKINKLKIIDVPVIDSRTNLTEYLNLYGEKCLYFGLTSQILGGNDCCWTSIQYEFQAMVYVGIDKWIDFVDKFNTLKSEIVKIYLDKYGVNPYLDMVQYTKNDVCVFRNGLFILKLNHFISYPFGRITPFLDVIKDDDALCNTNYFCKLNAKLDSDNDFPESVKDRLAFIFDESVALKYEQLLNYKFKQ